MEEYSNLLQSQIRQYLGTTYPIDPQLRDFIRAINQTYKICETDHLMHHTAISPAAHSQDKAISTNTALLKTILDEQTEFVCRFLADGTLTFVNEAYCRYFGKNRSQLIGSSFMPVIPEEDLAGIKDMYRHMTPDNPLLHTEHRVIMPDGNIRWHQWTDKGFFDEAGKVIEVLGIGRDITEKKKAELELRESEEGYKNLFEATFDGLVVHDNGIVLDVNQASLDTLQYTLEEVLGTSILDYIQPDLREEAKHRLKQNYSDTYETIAVKKDGTPVHIEVISKQHRFKGKVVKVAAYRDITQRKMYEKEIYAQQVLLKKILNHLPINIFLKDRNGKFVFINQNGSQTIGKAYADLLGKTDFDLFPEEVAWQLVADDQKVWESKTLFSYEEKIIINNKPMHMLAGKTIIQTNDLVEPLLLGYSIDITDRATAEQELRSKEMFIRQVLDTGTNLIFVKDLQGNFMLVNQATADLFGMTKEELILRNNYEVHQRAEENEHFIRIDRQVIEQGITIEIEEYFTKPNGEVLWFHTVKKPLFLEDGQVHVLAIAVDITKQKLATAQLQTSELKYRQLVEHATDMIYGCDFKGYFIYANPVTSRILGYTEEELRSKHYLEFVTPEYQPVLAELYKKQFSERIPDTYVEFKAFNAKGEQIWVGQNVHMLLENGRITCFQTVGRDITERKKAEEEIIQAKQIAEKSMRAKEQFLSVMSHEIRTPLNAVIGLTHLLLEENPLPEQVEQLNAIKFSADNLMVIINDILDFSKIESGKINFENISFETAAIFKGIYQSFKFKAEEKNLQLLVTLDEKLPRHLTGDPIKLNQILLNLVSNAIKFTDKGHIELKASLLAQTESKCSVEFKVIDTGIGIAEDKMAHVFESFTQASSETARKYGGTGLGLTITKRLVELQGGNIHVKSHAGAGSEFTVCLTFDKTAHPKQLHGPDSNEKNTLPGLAGVRILLVEDNKMNQLVVCKFLKKWGVEADVAEDGIQAIEKLKNNRYALILMDLQMPHMDGYATTRFIRTQMQDYLKNIPILALTASALLDVKKNVLDMGMNDFITKPFDPKDLRNKIINYAAVKGNFTEQVQVAKKAEYRYIDLNYLEEISANDKEFIREMIKLFIKQTPGFIDALQQACITSDWNTIKYIAHKMKATIAMIGIAELKPVISQIENYAGQQSNMPEIKSLVRKIAVTCSEVYDELHEKLEIISHNR